MPFLAFKGPGYTHTHTERTYAHVFIHINKPYKKEAAAASFPGLSGSDSSLFL